MAVVYQVTILWLSLPLAVFMVSVGCEDRPPEPVTVSIKSQMGANTILLVHCISEMGELDNLGGKSLRSNETYTFSPRPELRKRAMYRCQFKAAGYRDKYLVVFFGLSYTATVCSCVRSMCPMWTVDAGGFSCGATKITTWY